MIPNSFSPLDSKEVCRFTDRWGDRDPLLQPARIYEDRPVLAQRKLAKHLKNDLKDARFAQRFNRQEARKGLATANPGIQIHAEKLDHELKELLSTAAWHGRLRFSSLMDRVMGTITGTDIAVIQSKFNRKFSKITRSEPASSKAAAFLSLHTIFDIA